ncbi:MAG: hypothetical protein MJ106_05855, partial [Lentisphaeria bacterium]|nr:hypothetical protein [Lentisphaeria bacterium]
KDNTASKDEYLSGTIAPTADVAKGPYSGERPDIVLRLTRNFYGDENYRLTYLFDAKYRIGGAYDNGVSYPPQDAFDQMHRYRDAIYFQNNHADEGLKREIIGGYVLFPGRGKLDDVRKSKFMETISQVNIGAFPMMPCDDANESLLKDFLREIITDKKWENDLLSLPAQKGMSFFPTAELEHVGTVLQCPNKAGKMIECETGCYFAARSGIVDNPEIVCVIIHEANETVPNEIDSNSLHPRLHAHWVLKSYKVSYKGYLGCGEDAVKQLPEKAREQLDSNTNYEIWKLM